MAIASVGFAELVLLLGLGGGLGIPLGVPPMPEDAVCAKVAPAECLFYVSWAGVASPDPSSGNQTEQLLAEPEVQKLIGEVERLIRQGIAQATERGGPQAGAMAEDAVKWGKVLITRPTAIYVTDFKPAPSGPPDVRAGAVVNVGDEAAALRAALDKYASAIPQLKVEKLPVNGETFYRFKLGPGPVVTAGMRGKYLVVAVGEGELEAMTERVRGDAPPWLAEVRKQLPVERVSTVSYLNVKAIVDRFGPLAGPKLPLVLNATGLSGVTTIASVTGLDATGMVNKTLVGTSGEPQGLLRLAMRQPLSAADLAGVPADATIAVAFKCDAEEVYQTFFDIVGKIVPDEKAQMLQGIADFEAETGLKLVDDVLRPLGDTWRLFDSRSGGGMFVGATVVVSLKDAKAAAATQEKLLKLIQAVAASKRDPRRGPSVTKFEFAGQTLHCFEGRQRDFFIAPTWCLTDKELIISLWPQGVKAYVARTAEADSLAAVPQVAAALQSGPIALTYVDQRRLFEMFYPILPIGAQAIANEMQRSGIDVSPAILPSAGAISRHIVPAVGTVRRTEAGIEMTARQTMPGGSGVASAPVAVALLLPAVQSAREAARRASSMNNLKQIGVAMHNYHDVHKAFPPAYKTDKDGKPGLSWRVLILPYIEQQALYERFKLDEPWDSAHNGRLIESMPPVYRSPNSTLPPALGKTNYLTIRGEKTAFSGNKGIGLRDITDGSSNTIMAVEAPDQTAVVWTKPDDYEYDAADPMKGLLGMRPGGFVALMCDGSVHFIPQAIDPETLVSLFERNDGKVVRFPFGATRPGHDHWVPPAPEAVEEAVPIAPRPRLAPVPER